MSVCFPSLPIILRHVLKIHLICIVLSSSCTTYTVTSSSAQTNPTKICTYFIFIYILSDFFRMSLPKGAMGWHFPFFLLASVTLPSVCSQFNPLSLEELGSNMGIQVFNQIVKSQPHDNIVISPHGIASVLGMLQLGADGKTKKQLTTAMRYSVNGACAPCILGWAFPGIQHGDTEGEMFVV